MLAANVSGVEFRTPRIHAQSESSILRTAGWPAFFEEARAAVARDVYFGARARTLPTVGAVSRRLGELVKRLAEARVAFFSRSFAETRGAGIFEAR